MRTNNIKPTKVVSNIKSVIISENIKKSNNQLINKIENNKRLAENSIDEMREILRKAKVQVLPYGEENF